MHPHDPSVGGVSRRQFVATLAIASTIPLARAATHAPASASALTQAVVPPSGEPTTLHVFAKPMHEMSYADTAELVAGAGFGGIDYTVRDAQGHVRPAKVEEDLPRAIDAAHAAGLKVEMITTAITSVREPQTEKLLRTAAKLGVKYYRLGYWNYDRVLGVVGTWERLSSTVSELAALNESLGLHGAIQNHAGGGVGAAVWDLYELLRDVDPRWLGVQYDIRHATVEGGTSWPNGLRLMRPWIRCTDIKDFRWAQKEGAAEVMDVPLGDGIVPFDAYFKLYHELTLRGPMSVHFEYPPFERNPVPLTLEEKHRQFSAAMRKDLGVLKAVMARNHVT